MVGGHGADFRPGGGGEVGQCFFGEPQLLERAPDQPGVHAPVVVRGEQSPRTAVPRAQDANAGHTMSSRGRVSTRAGAPSRPTMASFHRLMQSPEARRSTKKAPAFR